MAETRTPGKWTEVDYHRPPRRCIVARKKGKPDKIVATIDYDTTGCRDSRTDTSMFCDHKEAWVNAKLIAAAGKLADALYYMGGGSVYLECNGRLCFCARIGKGTPDYHATTCNDAFDAWKLAGCPVPPGEPVPGEAAEIIKQLRAEAK